MSNILIIGATSAIASATARLWAEKKNNFFLVGRDETKLLQTANDLTVRGAKSVEIYVSDLNDVAKHDSLVEICFAHMKKIDIVLLAHGTLPNQKQCQQDVKACLHQFSNNGVSVISLLTLISNHMMMQPSGTIAVLSSVAGDRGRLSNYVYASAKAALTVFCEGLSIHLARQGIHMLIIKPGFVRSPMTKDLILPSMLTSSPDKIAKIIHKGIVKKYNAIYAPFYWRPIMFVIKMIPNFIFKKLNL